MKTQKQTISSYYHYSLRSLKQNRRTYLLLAASIFCMLVLCAGVLIYYASSYEAELETIRRENGAQHIVFEDIATEEVSRYIMHPTVRQSLVLPLYASAENPDPAMSFSQIFFAPYTEETAEFFYITLTAGRRPTAMGEIMISEDALRYFPFFTYDETQDVQMLVQGRHHTVPLHVVGVFQSATPATQYAFVNDETAEYLKGDGTFGYHYTNDVYLIFNGRWRTDFKQAAQTLITDFEITASGDDGESRALYYDERNDMLSELALVRPFYERESMQMMFLFSILPSAIALAVFLYLDMQKNMAELATLSMIGATWKQIFRMQMLKYGLIYLSVFPVGTAASVVLMKMVCALTNRISPDKIFLWYRFDFGCIAALFLSSAAVLTAVVYIISKKMTAVAHSEMLSAVHTSGNIFVSKTSNLLFGETRLLDRISLLFFTRNRKVNQMFCLVMVLLFCIDSFFTMQATREYAAAPDAAVMTSADYIVSGDAAISKIYDTVSPNLQEILEDIPHVKQVQRTLRVTGYYTEVDEISPQIIIEKQLVRNDVIQGQFGGTSSQRVWKRGNLDLQLTGMDEALMCAQYENEVIEGDLTNLFQNENTLALVVNAWSEDQKYYHVGDTVQLYTAYYDFDSKRTISSEQRTCTIGAILYEPEADLYDKVISAYTSPELFTEITGIEDIESYSILCDTNEPEVLSAVHTALASLETEYRFTTYDLHEQLRLAKETAMHAMLFVYVMKCFVLIVTAILLIVMTRFMLAVKAPSMRAMRLIGAEEKQLSHINRLEFFIASACSAAVGILFSWIGTRLLTSMFDLSIYQTTATTILIGISLLMMTALDLGVPMIICKKSK